MTKDMNINAKGKCLFDKIFLKYDIDLLTDT